MSINSIVTWIFFVQMACLQKKVRYWNFLLLMNWCESVPLNLVVHFVKFGSSEFDVCVFRIIMSFWFTLPLIGIWLPFLSLLISFSLKHISQILGYSCLLSSLHHLVGVCLSVLLLKNRQMNFFTRSNWSAVTSNGEMLTSYLKLLLKCVF